MKKSLLFSLVGLCSGISIAFAGVKFGDTCEDYTQYYYQNGVGYVEVPLGGYACLQGGTNAACTYYRTSVSPVTYTLCVKGFYISE